MTKLTLKEVSSLVGISRQAIYNALHAGKISRNNDKSFNLDEVLRVFPQSEYNYTLHDNVQESVKQRPQVDTALHDNLTANQGIIDTQKALIEQLKQENERLMKEKTELWDMYKEERERASLLLLPKPKKKRWFF